MEKSHGLLLCDYCTPACLPWHPLVFRESILRLGPRTRATVSSQGIGILRSPCGVGSQAPPPEPPCSGDEQTHGGAENERRARAIGTGEPSGQDIARGHGTVEEEDE